MIVFLPNWGDAWMGDHDPTTNEETDFGTLRVNNWYMNSTTKDLFECMDVTPNAQVWLKRSPVQPDWNSSSGLSQILNKPSLSAVATSGSYNDLSNKPTIPAAQVNSDWNATSGIAQILNKPSRSIDNALTRSIVTGTGATGFQISSTRMAQVSYSVTISTTSSLSGNASGYVVLETALTNSATPSDWVEIARTPTGQNNTLVVGVNLIQIGGGTMGGLTIAAGSFVKIRSVNVSGTPTYALNSQQEVLL